MKTFAGLLASASLVAGHGYVTNATIGSSSYTFYQPYTDPYTSPTPERVSRPIQGNGPVTVVTYNDLQCGGDTAAGIDGSSPANLTASVAAGSTVDLYWTTWPTSHVGPTITYMAKCANDDCTTYMPGNDTVWFKVQEHGRDGTSDTWGSTALMTAGGSVSYTIPECIESGAYLVRHEIIALHAAGTEGGAQFYPGCHQITVTGGTGASTPSNLVAFPGAYKATDAGITYNAYAASTYTVPGPALFSCSGSSSSSSGSSSGSSAAASSAPAAAATTAQASSAATTLATVTASSSATTSVAVAAAQTTAPSATTTDDGCTAEETVTSTISANQAVATGSASGSSSSTAADDGCDAETDTGSVTAGAATNGSTSGSTNGSTSGSTSGSASAGMSSADDGCDAESAQPTATGGFGGYGQSQPTGSYAGGSSSQAQPTGSASSDDCSAEEELAYARRFTGRFARGL